MPLFRSQLLCHNVINQVKQGRTSYQLFAHWHKHRIIKGVKHRNGYFTISGLNRFFSPASFLQLSI